MIFDADGNPVLSDDDMDWGGEEEAADKERAVTVIAENHRIEFDELGTSPCKAVKAAQALGWEVRAWLSETRVAPVLFVGSNDNHSAGDVRYPEFTARHYAIEARRPGQPLGFRAHYTGTSKDSSPKSAKFEYAWIADPVGVPVENWADYSPGAIKQAKDESYHGFQQRVKEAQEAAARRDAEYNDGSSRLETFHCFTTATEFEAWLDDWLTLAGLDTISRKKPEKKDASTKMLAGEEVEL